MNRTVIHRWRSAVTGRYVARTFADANPETTIRETVVLTTDEDVDPSNEPPLGRTEKE